VALRKPEPRREEQNHGIILLASSGGIFEGITMEKTELQDLYFMDSRAKLLDIASFLDRLERGEGEEDFRQQEFLKALQAMQNPPKGKSRAQAVLESLSDHSTEPAEAASISFAYGAPSHSR
jgi:hypothetical protein